MSDNQYIKKQQRARGRALITTRNIILITLLSGAVYAGFYMEYGSINDAACQGDCENLHGFWAWVLGFFIMFAVVISAGAAVGALLAFFKWSRRRGGASMADLIQDTDDKQSN